MGAFILVVVMVVVASASDGAASPPERESAKDLDVTDLGAPDGQIHLEPLPEPNDPASSTNQTLTLAVRGGDLTIDPGHVELELAWDGQAWSAPLPRITVVDARGTLDGWEARAVVHDVTVVDSRDGSAELAAAEVTIEPGAPGVVHGREGEVSAGSPFTATEPGVVFRADAEGGGGTFTGGGTVKTTIPGAPEAVVAHVELSLS